MDKEAFRSGFKFGVYDSLELSPPSGVETGDWESSPFWPNREDAQRFFDDDGTMMKVAKLKKKLNSRR